MRILTLQKGLGLEQSDFLFEEARQSGYTESEINGEQEDDDNKWSDEEVERRQEEYEWNKGLTTEELAAQKEEHLENGFTTTEDDSEWSDEDRACLSEEIAAEKEVDW